MNILDVVQGTPEWDAARARHFTASEAPAVKPGRNSPKPSDAIAKPVLMP